MASNTNPSVLIVGAGPTGLILGTELCRRDIHVRLIDQRSHPATSSRAFTVHSRTLEAFESIGICSYALTRGLRATEMKYHFVEEGKSVSSCINLRFSSDVVSGRFPFICTMPQTVTEELCRQAFEASGGVIEWGVSLDSFEELDGVVRTVLATEGRGTERAEFPFLVGCDGAKSSVRKGLDLDFSGTAYTGMTMKMMDVSLNNSLPKEYGPEGYHYFIKQGSMLLLVCAIRASLGSRGERIVSFKLCIIVYLPALTVFATLRLAPLRRHSWLSFMRRPRWGMRRSMVRRRIFGAYSSPPKKRNLTSVWQRFRPQSTVFSTELQLVNLCGQLPTESTSAWPRAMRRKGTAFCLLASKSKSFLFVQVHFLLSTSAVSKLFSSTYTKPQKIDTCSCAVCV